MHAERTRVHYWPGSVSKKDLFCGGGVVSCAAAREPNVSRPGLQSGCAGDWGEGARACMAAYSRKYGIEVRH